MRQREAAEVAKRSHELELTRLGQGNVDDRPRNREDRAKAPKFPSFLDGKDDLNAYLQSSRDLQRELSEKKKDGWASKLGALLSGRALEVYSRLSRKQLRIMTK